MMGIAKSKSTGQSSKGSSELKESLRKQEGKVKARTE
jgi:hypothetical protein